MSDTFTYVVQDSDGGSSVGTVTVVIEGQNDVPSPQSDTVLVVEDDAAIANGNLLANDTDIDAGTQLSIASVQGSTATVVAGVYGILNWSTDGNYEYVLDNSKAAVQRLAVGQTLSEEFDVTVSDGISSVTSTLTIVINGVNDAPTAEANTNSLVANSRLDIASGAYDDQILSDLPVAYWRLSESEGTVASNRLAPNTPDGLLNGTAAVSTVGLIANAADPGFAFDGSQAISIADSTLINNSTTTAKTIELWFNAADVQSRQVLYTQGRTTAGLNLYINAGRLYFGTWTGNSFGPIVSTAINSHTTYHVAGVFGSSRASLFVNGAQVASETTPFASIASHPGITTSAGAMIGGAVQTRFENGAGGAGFRFVGTIDEVAVYNAPLTAEQLTRHYAATGLLSNDTDIDLDETLTVTAVNGLNANVGRQVRLPSGGLLTVQADGSYQYDPNGAFDHLNAGRVGTDSFTYSVRDKAGATSTATVTLTVQGVNDAPTGVTLSNLRIGLSNVVGVLTTIDRDLPETESHTYELIGDNSQLFAIQNNQLIVRDRSSFVMGEIRLVTIEVTDAAGASLLQVFPLTVVAVPPPPTVTSVQQTTSAVKFRFSDPVDLSSLNLYDGVDSSVDAADVTIVGATVGPVRGSLVWNALTNTLTFIKTGGPLLADNYTATLASRSDGLKGTSGLLLDGDSNGVPGGNFVTNFTVAASSARVLSVPDFARGATATSGQSVNLALDNGNPGIPLTLSDGTGVVAMEFDVVYNPQMLDISSTFFNVLPAGWTTAINLLTTAAEGRARISLSGATPLGSGTQVVTRLLGSTVANTPYGSADLVRIERLSIFTQASGATPVASRGDDGLHSAVFIGDTNADGLYTAQDAGWIAGVRLGITTGFDAHSWIDPVIVADVNQNGGLDSLDSSWVSRKGLNPALQPEIPNRPAGSIPVAAGVLRTLAVDQLVPGVAGSLVRVPVRVVDTAVGLYGVDATIGYNTNISDLPNGLNSNRIELSGMFASEGGWTIDSFTNDATGQTSFSIYRATASSSVQGEIANVAFQIASNAPLGETPLDLSGPSAVPPSSFNYVDGSILVGANNPPPTVVAAIASSSQWGASFIDAVDGGGSNAGNGRGIALTVGSAPIPHDDVNRLYVQFSEAVTNAIASNFELRNSLGTLPFTLSYDNSTFIATLTLANALPFGKYRLAVSDQVTDSSGRALDGDLSGVAGGVFNFRFNVLPGDANGDGRVNGVDLTPFVNAFNSQAGQQRYNPRVDWNADARVNGSDLTIFSLNFNRQVGTLAEPGAPFGGGSGSLARRAHEHDYVFSEIGIAADEPETDNTDRWDDLLDEILTYKGK